MNDKPTKRNKIPPKTKKPKGPVTLGRTTFIDEILKRTESQPLVGFKRTTSRQPNSSLQATESPSEAFAKIHSQTEGIEKYSQEIENPCINFLQEANSSNLREGEGETGETGDPTSPIKISQTISSPDKGSVVQLIQNQGPESPQIVGQQEIPIIPDKGSVVKAIPAPACKPINSLEIPKGYCTSSIKWPETKTRISRHLSRPLCYNIL